MRHGPAHVTLEPPLSRFGGALPRRNLGHSIPPHPASAARPSPPPAFPRRRAPLGPGGPRGARGGSGGGGGSPRLPARLGAAAAVGAPELPAHERRERRDDPVAGGRPRGAGGAQRLRREADPDQ